MSKPKRKNGDAKHDGGRNKILARVHCLKRDLGLDDETYRAMLVNSFGVDSAGKMSRFLLRDLVRSMERSARKKARKTYPGRPRNMETDRGRQLGKIEALLAEAARPWAYADGISRTMYGVERVQWCNASQLKGVITALTKDAKRHGRHTE